MNTHVYSTLLIVIIETPISIVTLNMMFTISNRMERKNNISMCQVDLCIGII